MIEETIRRKYSLTHEQIENLTSEELDVIWQSLKRDVMDERIRLADAIVRDSKALHRNTMIYTILMGVVVGCTLYSFILMLAR